MTTMVVQPVEFDGSEIELHGNAYHHLIRVKRLKVGEDVRVVDGEGRARRGVLARADRDRGVVALGAASPSREPTRQVELLVAPPDPNRAAWLIEKATELGVFAVRFVTTARSTIGQRDYGASVLSRLHRLAVAAVEQCGRSRVPDISTSSTLDETLVRSRPEGTLLCALDPIAAAASELWPATENPAGALQLGIWIGPEGGWSDDERALFDRAGVRRVAIGERILRIETAAVVACALALLVDRR